MKPFMAAPSHRESIIPPRGAPKPQPISASPGASGFLSSIAVPSRLLVSRAPRALVAAIITSHLIVGALSGQNLPRAVLENRSGIHQVGSAAGSIRHKLVSYYESPQTAKPLTPTFDSTVLDLRTLSDSAYLNKYDFWKEVPVSRWSFQAPLLADVDGDGRVEFYGHQKFYETQDDQLHGVILEYDGQDSFPLVHSYADSVTTPLELYDIDRDGLDEIVHRTTGMQSVVHTPESSGMLPTSLAFGFNPYAGSEQMDDPTFGDFDRNGLTDVAYYLSNTQLSMFVSEYAPLSQSMDTVYRFTPPDFYSEGFSFGDFDMDGRTDIVLGSIHGYVYVVEAQGVHQYNHVWTGDVETYNAYLHMRTNDIDGNGLPEFWVGGDAYYSGVGMTRFTCFERAGDNSYRIVHRIDLVGVFSFFAGNCFARDVDGDGKQELFICIDQHVIILKFTGQPNAPSYELEYLKRNELAGLSCVFRGATLFDVTSDSRDEIVITLGQVNNDQRRDFTRIYKPTPLVNVSDDPNPVPDGYQLYQNYPNPFNSGTVIRYALPRHRDLVRVQVRVFDLLGGEVKVLMDALQPTGLYEIRWIGDDNAGRNVGTGTYLIVLEAGERRRVTKAILIR